MQDYHGTKWVPATLPYGKAEIYRNVCLSYSVCKAIIKPFFQKSDTTVRLLVTVWRLPLLIFFYVPYQIFRCGTDNAFLAVCQPLRQAAYVIPVLPVYQIINGNIIIIRYHNQTVYTSTVLACSSLRYLLRENPIFSAASLWVKLLSALKSLILSALFCTS